ncbi:hypothetical protein LBMAG43_16840 [Methylococcaceae bacterium]|nr:hypothetical protein LBMAG43_16840 [Methylococcaceae bacterium]
MNDNNPVKNPALTLPDIIFIISVIAILMFLGWSGSVAYSEGVKTETTKRNGEEWASWLTQAGTERFNTNYVTSECAPTATISNTDTNSTDTKSIPRTWGECLKAIMTPPSSLAALTNPFFDTPITFGAKCDHDDESLTGLMILEKLTPTPSGSALPFTTSKLVESDRIDQKMQIRITVCDNEAFPIFIAEVEF